MRPREVLMGPILSANRGGNMFHCDDCGYDGVLVMFESEEARDNFRAKKTTVAVPEAQPPRIESIPIIPVRSKEFLGSALLESAPLKTAEVVSVRWNGTSIEKAGYEVDFDKYWAAVGSSRYRAETLYVLDISGINHAEPSFSAMRELAKADCKLLFDLGAGSPGEIMDGFMVDVEKVIASTKSLRTPRDFQDIYALTDNCIPCIDWDGGIVWSEGKRTDSIPALAKMLSGIGYGSLVLMDLRRLGTLAGPDPELTAMCSKLEIKTMLGGGIKEEDLPALFETGVSAALIDPYTPLIKDLVWQKTKEPKAVAVAPQPSPAKDVRPAPV